MVCCGVHVAVTSFPSLLAGKVAVAILFEILRCSCLLGCSVQLSFCVATLRILHLGKYCSCLNVDEECASAPRGSGARLFAARNRSVLPRNVSVAGSGEEKRITVGDKLIMDSAMETEGFRSLRLLCLTCNRGFGIFHTGSSSSAYQLVSLSSNSWSVHRAE